jgi:hypothetical protein
MSNSEGEEQQEDGDGGIVEEGTKGEEKFWMKLVRLWRLKEAEDWDGNQQGNGKEEGGAKSEAAEEDWPERGGQVEALEEGRSRLF